MKTATVTEAKNRLSALIDQVRAGESITITDRGTPVARLEPLATQSDQIGRLERLQRAGLVRVGRGSILEVIRVPPPAPRKGADAVGALIEERRQGR